MKFWSPRDPHDDAVLWRDDGFLAEGHYAIAAIEDTGGWTSPDKVILDKGPEELRRLIDLAFRSIDATSVAVERAAVAQVRAEQYRDMGNFLLNSP